MTIFLILFLTILLLAIFDTFFDKKIGLIFGGTLLSLVAGLRYFTGLDYISYYSQYNGMSFQNFEWGYTLLTKVFKYFNLSFYDFEFFFSALTMSLLIVFLYKYIPSSIATFSLLYYYSRFFWVRDLGQIRSSLASIILLYSIKYIKERNFLKFIIIVLIASSIHKASFIFLFVYFISVLFKDSLSFNKVLLLLSFSTILGVIFQYIPSILQTLFPNNVYLFAKEYVQNSSGSYMTLIMQLGILLLGVLLINKKRYILKDLPMYLNVYLSGLLIALLFIGYLTLGYRLDTIMNTTEIIVLPTLILRLVEDKRVYGMIITIISVIIFYLIMIHSQLYLQYIPFRTYIYA